MIHRLADMIGSAQDGQSHPTRGYVRAVPLPFYGGFFDRLRDARAVIAGKAFAVRWPEGGELEDALRQGAILCWPSPRLCRDIVPGSQNEVPRDHADWFASSIKNMGVNKEFAKIVGRIG